MVYEDVLIFSSEEKEALLFFASWVAGQSQSVAEQVFRDTQCLEDIGQGKPVYKQVALDAVDRLGSFAEQSGNVRAAKVFKEVARDLIPLVLDDELETKQTRLCPGCPGGWCPGCSPI
jgi:hypothetical protein